MNLDLKTGAPLGRSPYEKSISDDLALLISKVQPCPTSSEQKASVRHLYEDKGSFTGCLQALASHKFVIRHLRSYMQKSSRHG